MASRDWRACIGRVGKMSKKDLVKKGMMQRARCHVGYYGIQPQTRRQFIDAFSGTVINPVPCDVVKVKIQKTFRGDVDDVIADLCASNNSKFLKMVGNCLIFYRRKDENRAGSD